MFLMKFFYQNILGIFFKDSVFWTFSWTLFCVNYYWTRFSEYYFTEDNIFWILLYGGQYFLDIIIRRTIFSGYDYTDDSIFWTGFSGENRTLLMDIIFRKYIF